MNLDEMKPGLIIGYPQMKKVGYGWHYDRKPTGKTLKALVIELRHDPYNPDAPKIWGYPLTKDGRISHSGWNNYSDNLQKFDDISEIVGPADEELVREARSLMLSEWVKKADPSVRQKAIEDAEYFAKVRAADWKTDVQRALIAEAKGVSVDDVALTERAKYIVDWRYTASSNLSKIERDAEVMTHKAAEFGIDAEVKEAFDLIAQAKSILDSLTVEGLLESQKQSL